MKPKQMLKTAGFRLTALYLTLFTSSVGILFAITFYTVNSALHDELKTRVINEINYLSHEYLEDGLPELIEETEERIEKAQGGERLSYYLKNDKGQIIFDPIKKLEKPYGWKTIEANDSEPLLVYSKPLENNYVLAVGGSLADIYRLQAILLKSLLWIILGVILVGSFVGYFLSRRALSQVSHITDTAQKIGDGSLNQRILIKETNDEYEALAKTLNNMFDRIELLVQNTRNVSTIIAHELRTPLGRIRQKLEEKKQSDIIKDLDDVLKTFSSILNISEIDTGQMRANFKSVSLSEVCRQMIELYIPVITEKNGELKHQIQDEINILADKNLIQQLLANLIENSILHAKDNNVEISVTLTQKADVILLQIADNGSGIPEDLHKDVFKPFFRLDSNNNKTKGTGLGLSLVSSICKLHHTEIFLEDNQPGLRVVLKFQKSY